MTNQTTDAMTSAEAAEALQRSVKTVTRWVAAGKLHPIKRLPGRRGAFLFAASEISAIIAGEPWEPSR